MQCVVFSTDPVSCTWCESMYVAGCSRGFRITRNTGKTFHAAAECVSGRCRGYTITHVRRMDFEKARRLQWKIRITLKGSR